MIKKKLSKMVESANKHKRQNIINLLDLKNNAFLLDLGCNDGEITIEIASKINTKNIYGIDIVDKNIELARKRGLIVEKADLNYDFPFEENKFDIIISNQVIEHLHDTDNYISEIYRILKPRGCAIISTENLSSWHNIFALILGFQPFSMTNFSSKGSFGNPFSLWRKKMEGEHIKSWEHHRLFAYTGLKELFELYGFKVEKIITAGYYPLPSFFAKIDKRHGHYITIKIRK